MARTGPVGNTAAVKLTRRLCALALMVLAACAGIAAPAGAARAASTASGGWHWTNAHHGLDDVSCPSAKLCVGISGVKAVFTTDITASKPKWVAHTVDVDPYVAGSPLSLQAISCPSTSFCAAVDNAGNMVYTTDPTGGASKWIVEDIYDGGTFQELTSVSCASATLCGAVDYDGELLVSGDPEGGAGEWHVDPIKPQDNNLTGVSCVDTLCVAAVDHASIEIATDATSTAPKFHAVKVKGSNWEGVSCPTTHRCVLSGSYTGTSGIAVSSDPGKLSSSAWKSFKTSDNTSFDSVDCESDSFCMAAGGEAYFTDRAAPKASAWHTPAQPKTGSEFAVTCPTTMLCIIPGVDGTFVGKA